MAEQAATQPAALPGFATRIWAAIGVAALAWGTTGVATRLALAEGVPPIAMTAARAAGATVVLYAILRWRGRRITRDRSLWRLGLVAGLLQLSVPFVLFTLAYQYASAGFIGLLVALVPLATAIAAHVFLPDERLDRLKLAGLGIAFAGVAFLLASGNSGLTEGGRPLLAATLALLAVASIGFASVYTKGHAGAFDPTELTWMQFAVGVVLITVAMLAFEGTPANFTLDGWLLVAYLTVAGSVLPFLLFYWVLERVSSTKASLIGYLVPPVALVAGAVILDEQLQVGLLVGGALILVGVVATDWAERRSERTPLPGIEPPTP